MRTPKSSKKRKQLLSTGGMISKEGVWVGFGLIFYAMDMCHMGMPLKILCDLFLNKLLTHLNAQLERRCGLWP